MALERFIPKSPDPFIRNSQDFEVAKFGHLNTIIEYINSYVVTDSLQLAGSGPITSTARYITDSLGNASAISISTIGVGIGTTNATARLRVITADTNGIAEFFQNGVASSPLHLTRYTGLVAINLNTAAGGSASPVPVGDNIQMSRITTNTYNGTTFGVSARIEVISKGIQSATNYGSNMRFQTTRENNINLNTNLALLSDGNVQIGADYNVALGARLGIKGSGSTSATTSLLVENSAGTSAFAIFDDRQVNFYNQLQGPLLRASSNLACSSFQTQNYAGTWMVVDDSTNVGNVNFGTVTAVASARVQIDSTTKGFLPPRMTTVQRDAVISPATGLKVYNTSTNTTDTYDGATWQRFGQQTLIKGSGSTSATTSLLVQNSAGTQLLKIADDGTINTSFSAVFNANFLLNVVYDISCRSIGANANAAGGTLGIFGGPGGNASGTAVSIGFSGSPVSGQIGTSLKIDPIVLQSATQIGISFNGDYTAASVFGNNTLIGYDFSPTNFGANPVLRAFQSSVGGVYVNTTSYQASAILQADSTTQGFLPPRMTNAQRAAIGTPAIGLMVYCTDAVEGIYVYKSTGWTFVA